MADDRYSRNEALFGIEGQERIKATKVAIVGFGGLGSHVGQQVTYMGTRHNAPIDFDVVTNSSLNRLIGAHDSDVAAETKKVEVAERMIKAINPQAIVNVVDDGIGAPDAEAAVASADVVFGCLDRDLSRLTLTEICSRYAKPLFDLASDASADDQDLRYGGRVLFANGNGCLVCRQLLDQQEMAHDSMSLEQREAHDRIYGIRHTALGETGPMVVSVNGVLASLAVTEFMVFVTGVRQPVAHLIYRGEVPVVRRVVDAPDPGCYYCTGIWGSAA